MGKVIDSGNRGITFAHGGSGHMFGKGNAHPAVAGQSGKESNSGGGGKFAQGGSGKMFGKGHAKPAVSGVSGKESQ